MIATWAPTRPQVVSERSATLLHKVAAPIVDLPWRAECVDSRVKVRAPLSSAPSLNGVTRLCSRRTFSSIVEQSSAAKTVRSHGRRLRCRAIDQSCCRTAPPRSSGDAVNGGAVAGHHLAVESLQDGVHRFYVSNNFPSTPLRKHTQRALSM